MYKSLQPWRSLCKQRTGFYKSPLAQARCMHERLTETTPPFRRIPPLPVKVGELRLRCSEFDSQGFFTSTEDEFRKTDFCQQHSLLPRDLRTIDTSSLYQKPSILVRSEAILVNMAHLKALIKWDRVVLFNTYGSADSYNQNMFIYDLQERLRSQKEELPFEFRTLEAMLIAVTSSLQSEMEVFEGPVNKLLNDLENLADIEESVNGHQLRELLQYTKKLSKFEQDCLSIRDVLEELLDHDDDLAAMYLTAKKTNKPRASSDHEEVELLLEAYLKQTEEIAAKASTLRSHMRSTEEIVQILLNVSRNSLIWYDIRLSIITLSATIVGVYGALFGMNLKNYFEDDPFAFGLVTGISLLSGVGVFAVSVRKLKTLAKIKV
ncbi:hypothetical protein BDF14DRAFT_1821004 [Spinellus fusiger]|nr:hypothetical protein BDF14DRAFT_1821004 [Spinellus fusiger]